MENKISQHTMDRTSQIFSSLFPSIESSGIGTIPRGYYATR